MENQRQPETQAAEEVQLIKLGVLTLKDIRHSMAIINERRATAQPDPELLGLYRNLCLSRAGHLSDVNAFLADEYRRTAETLVQLGAESPPASDAA